MQGTELTNALTSLPGDYRLTLVATSGAKADRRVEGALSLRVQNQSFRDIPGINGAPLPGVSQPVIGGTDIVLDSVSALRLGDLASSDSTKPGVAVLETADSSRVSDITIRLGSDANRRGEYRFDGGYTVLTVRSITPQGFFGQWRSGVTSTDAEGYFCAVRVNP